MPRRPRQSRIDSRCHCPLVPDWLRERVGKTAAATLSGYAAPEAAVKEALSAAEQAAAELEADPANYRVGEVADNAWCLVPEAGRWSVFWSHGGEKLEIGLPLDARGGAHGPNLALYTIEEEL